MFNGFTKEQLLIHKPKILIDILATEVARTNAALAAVSEELRQLKEQKEQREED